jgi:hypothetical protein
MLEINLFGWAVVGGGGWMDWLKIQLSLVKKIIDNLTKCIVHVLENSDQW